MTLRTVTLPTQVGASWDDFAWPAKNPADALDYALDCTDWLADAGLTLVSATAAASPGLTVTAPTTGAGIVAMEISAGTPSTNALVALMLTLSSGRVLNVLITLPITAGLPGGLIAVPGAGTPRLVDDFASLLADDFGGHLLAA